MHILGELDVKGTGDIEFDEFIFFMTRPQVYPNQTSRLFCRRFFVEFRKNVNGRRPERHWTADRRCTEWWQRCEKEGYTQIIYFTFLANQKREFISILIGSGHHREFIVKEEKGTPGDVLFTILQRVLEQENNTEIRNFYRQQILKWEHQPAVAQMVQFGPSDAFLIFWFTQTKNGQIGPFVPPPVKDIFYYICIVCCPCKNRRFQDGGLCIGTVKRVVSKSSLYKNSRPEQTAIFVYNMCFWKKKIHRELVEAAVFATTRRFLHLFF